MNHYDPKTGWYIHFEVRRRDVSAETVKIIKEILDGKPYIPNVEKSKDETPDS